MAAEKTTPMKINNRWNRVYKFFMTIQSTKNEITSLVKVAVFLILLSVNFQPILLYAEHPNEGNNANGGRNIIYLDNPLGDKVNNLPAFIYMVLDIVFQIGAVLAVLFLMYVGFMFVTARGDPEKLQTARRAFLYTVIGIALLLGGKLVASVIGNTITQVSTGIY